MIFALTTSMNLGIQYNIHKFNCEQLHPDNSFLFFETNFLQYYYSSTEIAVVVFFFVYSQLWPFLTDCIFFY